MAERGVRFTQIYKRGWDVHDNVVGNLPVLCQETDRGCYALVTDLKRRGLLDDTLVIWAWRIRTHRLQPGRAKPGELWPRPSSALFHGLDGRCRRAPGSHLWRD